MTDLILHIPHASTYIPEDCFPKDSKEYQILSQDHPYMVDWYVDQLFDCGLGTAIIAPVSRMVCDTERFLDDSQEPMSRIGMGVCYQTTHDLKHHITITATHRSYIVETYYKPHHQALQQAIDNSLSNKHLPILLDCHSFSPIPLPYEFDQSPQRPDICLGTDALHTSPALIAIVSDFFKRLGYTVQFNRPYAGALVPLKYLQTPQPLALMIEINRRLYLSPNSPTKLPTFSTLSSQLQELQQLLLSLPAQDISN